MTPASTPAITPAITTPAIPLQTTSNYDLTPKYPLYPVASPTSLNVLWLKQAATPTLQQAPSSRASSVPPIRQGQTVWKRVVSTNTPARNTKLMSGKLKGVSEYETLSTAKPQQQNDGPIQDLPSIWNCAKPTSKDQLSSTHPTIAKKMSNKTFASWRHFTSDVSIAARERAWTKTWDRMSLQTNGSRFLIAWEEEEGGPGINSLFSLHS